MSFCRASLSASVSKPAPLASQQGFVLIAVLGMIMLLSLIASFVASYADQRLEQAIELRSRWQQHFAQEATLATVQFMLATTERNTGGWEVEPDVTLRTDNRPYYGLGSTVFAAQDEASLLSVLDPDRDRWQRLLYKEGLSANEAEQLLDQLQDYTDQDDLRRLNGANSIDYQQAGLAPPTQRFMISPGQLFNLLNAAQWRPLLYKLLPLSTTRSGQLLNINTAPQAVLATLPVTDDSVWQELVAERADNPFSSLGDANQRLGRILPLDAMSMPTLPSNFIRLQLWSNDTDCRQATWIGLTLTPSSNRAPWEIDYVFDYQHSQPCRTPAELAAAPLAR